MQVSICIVSYNCREELLDCLRSIEEHGAGVQHEVIIVDNASTDGSAEAAERACSYARVLRNSENRGFAAAANQAAKLARGQILLFLNPDTELKPGALDRVWHFLHERPWVGACGLRLIDSEGKLIRSCRRFPSLWTVTCEALGLSQLFPRTRLFGSYDLGWWAYDRSRPIDWVSGAALAITRRAWELVGPFDEGFFIYAEELDWLRRLRRAQLECWYVHDAVVSHRDGRSWEGLDVLRVLWSHWSLWHYFRKHHGRWHAALVRLMTGLGAALRILVWLLISVAPSLRKTGLTRAGVHELVLRQCLTGYRPSFPGASRPAAR